jgi:hypothetical protein
MTERLGTTNNNKTSEKIYRMIQEERSIFWEMIALVIVRKNVHVNMCLILNGYQDRAV